MRKTTSDRVGVDKDLTAHSRRTGHKICFRERSQGMLSRDLPRVSYDLKLDDY